MTSLILHVGPPKCGSKSIQQFFATQEKPCIENTHFTLLNPLEISELNCEQPGESILTVFTQLLSDNLIGCDVHILSHEHLFQCPYAIKNICSLAKNLVTKISIIGYSRRQSDFLISAYSQWGFRSRDLMKGMPVVLDSLGLDPALFSGLEQYLITYITNDFDRPEDRIYDWHNSYKNVLQLMSESDTVVKCGVLPSKGSDDISLIQDFCEKSDLTLRDEMKDAGQQIFNVSFNQDIIEAISNAIAFGLDMPGPDESNDILELLSAKEGQMTNKPSEFLFNMKSYIDTFFLNSNQQLCQEYGLSETYFAPAVRFGKPEIMAMIMHEGQQRASNKSMIINNYRMLSARMIELCLKLAKEKDLSEHNLRAQAEIKPKHPNLPGAVMKLFKH